MAEAALHAGRIHEAREQLNKCESKALWDLSPRLTRGDSLCPASARR
jgi:hypothetical protein